MKKLSVALIAAGCLLAAAAFLLPAVATLTAVSQNPGSVGIIGGADLPTYRFLFEDKFAWLAWLGGIVAVAGVVLRLTGRKGKDK